MSPDGQSADTLAAYNYVAAETTISTGSWSYPATGSRSVMIRDPDYARYVVALGSYRSGQAVRSNVFQFYGVQNPATSIPWGAAWDDDSQRWISIWADASGTATVPFVDGTSEFLLLVRDLVPPYGFRRGIANSYKTVKTCSAGTNVCKASLVGSVWQCSGGTIPGYGGVCGWDASGRCAPTKNAD